MKSYKLSAFSLIFSIAGLIVQFIINYKMSIRYISSGNKTKALFGLVEVLSFSYKYYFLILGVVAFAFGTVALVKKEAEWLVYTALALSILSIASEFIQLWKLFV